MSDSTLVGADRGPVPLEAEPGPEERHERASASRVVPARASLVADDGAPQGAPVIGPLASLQRWFAQVMTHPDGVEAGFALANPSLGLADHEIGRVLKPSPTLAPAARIQIYWDAYHLRLIECVADDYPVLKQAMGEAAFEALARRYLAAYPSRGPNLNRYARRLSELLRAEAGVSPSFYADLADLEWAMVEIIHAPRPVPIATAALQAIPMARWGDVKLRPSASLRFLEQAYPSNAYFQAVRNGQSPALPEPAWSATAIYRRDRRVWRMSFTRPMASVLRQLLDGATLGQAMGSVAGAPPEAGDVQIWFKEWLAGGFFESLYLDE